MRSGLAFGLCGTAARHKAALALYLITCAFGLGLSAEGKDWKRKPVIITFDAPDAGTGEYQGTYPQGLNASGEIVGFSLDVNYVLHAFLRAPNGTFTTVEAPGASPTIGTGAYTINAQGTIGGAYGDDSNVLHGFLRFPEGRFVTFEAPGAGTGYLQGTLAYSINPEDEVAGPFCDASSVSHGFLRASDGSISTFEAPNAGHESAVCGGQGTFVAGTDGLNPQGYVAGNFR